MGYTVHCVHVEILRTVDDAIRNLRVCLISGVTEAIHAILMCLNVTVPVMLVSIVVILDC